MRYTEGSIRVLEAARWLFLKLKQLNLSYQSGYAVNGMLPLLMLR